MRKTILALLLAAPLLAVAGNSLNGVRIGANDVAALARSCQAVLGMHEVQRVENPQFTQVRLDFGAHAAGGQVERELFAFSNTGMRIAFARDPAGNHFELLQSVQR